MISTLRVTLARDKVRAARGGEAGQWWSLLLPEVSEVTGDEVPSYLPVGT